MIVLSASMQKSGSGWYFNLTNAMLASHGGDDLADLRDRARLLGRAVRVHGSTRPLRMAALLTYHVRGRRFAVKTHAAPSASVRALSAVHALRATYCYRDLRDVALSALDHRRQLTAGPNIGAISDLEDAFRFAATLVPKWRAWTALPDVLTVRYEDLRADPAAEIERLAKFLDIELEPGAVDALLERFPPGAGSEAGISSLHFNKGEVARFREVFTPEDLRLSDEILGPHLDEMGYERH